MLNLDTKVGPNLVTFNSIFLIETWNVFKSFWWLHFGFELMLTRESAKNLFRLLECRNINTFKLKGWANLNVNFSKTDIYDWSCCFLPCLWIQYISSFSGTTQLWVLMLYGIWVPLVWSQKAEERVMIHKIWL